MTDTVEPLTTRRDDAQLLLGDLARICGTLSEIATVWRRALPYLPGLPLSLPLRLQDAACQLAADIQAPVGTGQPSDPGPLSLPGRFSALRESIAAAQAMTCGPGIPRIGDDRLWQSLSTALNRAGTTHRPHAAPGHDQRLVTQRPPGSGPQAP